MSGRIHKTAHAEADIKNIALWIARDSVESALKWAADLDEKLRTLAQVPGSGTDRGKLRPGMRSSPFGNYLIFFKRVRNGIQIIRVIHGARDYTRYFRKGTP